MLPLEVIVIIVIAVVTIIAIAIAIVSIIDVAVVGVFCRPRQKLKGCRRQLWPHFCVTKAKLQLEWLDLASAKVISSLMASLQAGSWLGMRKVAAAALPCLHLRLSPLLLLPAGHSSAEQPEEGGG